MLACWCETGGVKTGVYVCTVCVLHGGMGNETAAIERAGSVISYNLFTTPTTTLTPHPSVQAANLLWPWTASLLQLSCRVHSYLCSCFLTDSLLMFLLLPAPLFLFALLYFWSGHQSGIHLLKARPIQYNGLPLFPLSEVSANICFIPLWHSVCIHSVLPLLLSCQCQRDGLKKCI